MSKDKKQEDPNAGKTFSVSVSDTVGVQEIYSGGGQPKKKEMSQEEIQKKVLERKVYLGGKYVPPHPTKARWVKEEDLDRVLKEAELMSEMCLVGRGEYNVAFALAHTQVCDKDPLRFFVRRQEESGRTEIIINPVILSTGGNVEMKDEGCMTFPEEPLKMVGRYKNARVEYQTLGQKVNKKTEEPIGKPFITDRLRQNLTGHIARVYQHEVQHLNGKYIYDSDHSIMDCVGCDDQPGDKSSVDKS